MGTTIAGIHRRQMLGRSRIAATVAAVLTAIALGVALASATAVPIGGYAWAAPEPTPANENVLLEVLPSLTAPGPTTTRPSDPGGTLPITGSPSILPWLVAIGAILVVIGGVAAARRRNGREG